MGRQKVIITDELEDRHSKLRSILQTNSIAATARLLTHNGSIGYIFLGYKKSGNPYSKLDVRMLDIIGDELVIAIQNALRFEEIQQFNVTLQQKIEEATRELRRVNHRLRELDKTKDEFISMASHQLRTPLTAVKGYLSMVLEGDAGKISKTQKDYTQKAFDGAQKMVYLIADMLNVSRLQTGKFVIENKPTDLAELVQGEVTQLETAAAEHQIKLVYHKPEKLPILSLDETKTRQVVMNFVDNAIYYTPAGGSVTVELESDDTEVRFKVTDTGLGVPASVQHHLFSKFYRADNARKVRPDGTGLGLFMAKKVVSAQGGAIIFRSTEGKGSVFGFSFPLSGTEVKDGKTPLTPKAEHNLAPAKTKV
jgi:signal transduction histidine kinase